MVDSVVAPPKKKARWGTLLRGAIGIGIVVLVFTRVPIHDLGARFAQVRAVDLALLVVLTLLQLSTGVLRWWRLLRRLGERPSLAAVYRDLLVGALFNTFLPTGFGGDVIRAMRMSRRLGSGYHAWSSSLFERLIGLLTLGVAGGLAVSFAIGDVLPGRFRLIVLAMAVLFTLVLFFASAPFRLLVRILEKRLPAAFISDIRGVVSDLEGGLATAGARLETFAWSVAGFLFNIAYALVAVRALSGPSFVFQHDLEALLVGVPIVSVLVIAPVSLGGHGLREALFVLVLGLLGMPEGVALGLGLMALAYNVFLAAIGGIVMLSEPVVPLRSTAPGAPLR